VRQPAEFVNPRHDAENFKWENPNPSALLLDLLDSALQVLSESKAARRFATRQRLHLLREDLLS
jgi:hypothetical protein